MGLIVDNPEPVLPHEDDCPAGRSEVHDVEGPDFGEYRVLRCLDCGASLTRQVTRPTPPPPQGDDGTRHLTGRVLAGLDRRPRP